MFSASAMDGSSVRFSLPSASLFKFPPASQPSVLPAPGSDFTYATLYQISPSIFNHFLSFNYPLAAAIIYIAGVVYMNNVNRQRNNQPWPLCRTKAFYGFTVVHNLAMTIFSASILEGMLQAMKHSWPGWHHENSLAEVVDAMCKIHGPRGLGAGVSFNSTTNIWTSTNVATDVTSEGTPDPTDLGRFWNEGLAFYGWLFYLSKFYGVLDTVIWLAEGKTSSMLQAFYHAGAMLSLWAGIRYMSPPIWMFVILNSAIHILMVRFQLRGACHDCSLRDVVHQLYAQVAGNAFHDQGRTYLDRSADLAVRSGSYLRIRSSVRLLSRSGLGACFCRVDRRVGCFGSSGGGIVPSFVCGHFRCQRRVVHRARRTGSEGCASGSRPGGSG